MAWVRQDHFQPCESCIRQGGKRSGGFGCLSGGLGCRKERRPLIGGAEDMGVCGASSEEGVVSVSVVPCSTGMEVEPVMRRDSVVTSVKSRADQATLSGRGAQQLMRAQHKCRAELVVFLGTTGP